MTSINQRSFTTSNIFSIYRLSSLCRGTTFNNLVRTKKTITVCRLRSTASVNLGSWVLSSTCIVINLAGKPMGCQYQQNSLHNSPNRPRSRTGYWDDFREQNIRSTGNLDKQGKLRKVSLCLSFLIIIYSDVILCAYIIFEFINIHTRDNSPRWCLACEYLYYDEYSLFMTIFHHYRSFRGGNPYIAQLDRTGFR
jgi:hypothetical protein